MTIAMPMVQLMILMTIYALLPFAIVASRYSLSIMAVGAIGIFTVNFWPVLWHMATWVDDNLTLALFPPEEEAGKRFLEYITDPEYFLFGNALDPKLTVLNMVTASLFLILPGIFTAVMAWAGIRAAGSITQLTRSLNSQGVSAAANGPSQSLGMGRGKVGKAAKAAGSERPGCPATETKGFGRCPDRRPSRQRVRLSYSRPQPSVRSRHPRQRDRPTLAHHFHRLASRCLGQGHTKPKGR